MQRIHRVGKLLHRKVKVMYRVYIERIPAHLIDSQSSEEGVLQPLERLVSLERRRLQASHHGRQQVVAELGDLILQSLDQRALEGADPRSADEIDVHVVDAGRCGVGVSNGIAEVANNAVTSEKFQTQAGSQLCIKSPKPIDRILARDLCITWNITNCVQVLPKVLAQD